MGMWIQSCEEGLTLGDADCTGSPSCSAGCRHRVAGFDMEPVLERPLQAGHSDRGVGQSASPWVVDSISTVLPVLTSCPLPAPHCILDIAPAPQITRGVPGQSHRGLVERECEVLGGRGGLCGGEFRNTNSTM